jgi:hypothetical protein
MTNVAQNKKRLPCLLWLIAVALYCQSPGQAIAQRQSANDKPWQELVSREGQFQVLLPDTPSELSVPGTSQAPAGGQLYFVKSSTAVYAVLFGDLSKDSEDPDMVKTAFESISSFLQASGKLRVVGEKNISSPGVQARQIILDDGAFVTTARIYYTKGHLYELIFSRPGVSGSSAGALLQFYDGLSGKFFNSFKIGS